MNIKISKWSTMQRTVIGIGSLLIIWLLWSILLGSNQMTTFIFVLLIVGVLFWNAFIAENDATRKIVNLPDSQIKIENDGNEFEIDVKMGSSSTSLANVAPKVMENLAVYYPTGRLASSTRKVADIDISIEIAMFNTDGEIIRIKKVPAKAEDKINIDKETEHIIMAPEGFFNKNNISVENNSKIIL